MSKKDNNSSTFGFTADGEIQQVYSKSQKRAEKKAERLQKQKDWNTRHPANVRVFDIVSIALVLMFTILLFSVLTDNDRDVSLFGLLEFFSQAKTINLADIKIIESMTIADNWGNFNFLRDFFNLLAGFFEFVAVLGSILINSFSYLWQFVKWIYIG